MCDTCTAIYSNIIYPPTNLGHKSCTRDKKGRLHSYNDEPAMVYHSGTKMWYSEGKLHREDGPAVIYPTTLVEHWKNGKYVQTGLTEKILVKDTTSETHEENIDLETFVVYCDLCEKSTDRNWSHEKYHLAGECKICTDPLQKEYAHFYCRTCKSCLKESEKHECPKK